MLALAAILGSCDDMNTPHQPYLDKYGERVYAGRIDDLISYAGYDRAKLRVLITTQRAVRMHLTWSEDGAATYDIPADAVETGYFEIVMDLPENDYIMKVVTEDAAGNKSISLEFSVSTYGDLYASTLLPRILKTAAYDDTTGELTLDWYAMPGGALYVEVSYTDTAGNAATVEVPASENSNVITDADITKPVIYKTAYVPEPDAIDIFFSPEATAVIENNSELP